MVPEATKDLPDPLEETPASASSSPDDLLSQMADEAIDKLIADADKGVSPPARSAVPASGDELTSLAANAPNASHADDSHAGDSHAGDSHAGDSHVGEATSEAEMAALLKDDSLQGELDSLFTQLDDVSPAAGPASDLSDTGASTAPLVEEPAVDERPAKEPLPAAQPVESDPMVFAPAPEAEPESPLRGVVDAGAGISVGAGAIHAGGAGSVMPPPVDVPPDIANDDGHGGSTAVEEQHAAAEAAMLAEPQPDVRADVKALLDDAVEQDRESGPGLLVKPLQWLNAPFSGLSDEARDKIGQVAIVTLINALAVILYVIIFRR